MNELKRRVVFEALDKFPNKGNHTIASYIWHKYPEYWSNYENVRSFVRYYRGNIGNRNREKIRTTRYVK